MEAIENNRTKLLRKLRYVYPRFFSVNSKFGEGYPFPYLEGQEASDAIKNELLADKPSFIGRCGSVELLAMLNYLSIKHHKGQFMKYIKWQIAPYWFEPYTSRVMWHAAGIFPGSFDILEKFTLTMLKDMPEMDILGSWRKEEIFFQQPLENSIKIRLADLDPFLHERPWTEALAGKKILVINPFKKSIEQQYQKRELLFKNQSLLPDFKLKVIQSVQSICGIKPDNFENWIEALDYMKQQMSKTDFDIAIIGCGAYGLPLAAHAKRMGKKAIHLGGITQLLFGITGKRWDENGTISNHINEHWVRPLPEETPQAYKDIEGGCYW